MSVTSVNLSVTPFASSCDSTRLNMASKQFSQSLTHLNCEIPYIISNEWSTLSKSSGLGIGYAEDDGEVILNACELLIIYYYRGDYKLFHIPPIRATTSIYCSCLRDSLPTGKVFHKDDILFEYDSFKLGIPSSGYNTNIAYFPFFGYNHEDSLVISENLAYRARHRYTENVYIPIYEFTLLSKIYDNRYGYFPEIGEKINGNIVASNLLPRSFENKKDSGNAESIKTHVIQLLNQMSLSDLINTKIRGGKRGFSTEKITSHIEDGILTGFKIHKLKKDACLIDKDLQQILEYLYKKYSIYVVNSYKVISNLINDNYARRLIKENFVYSDRDKIRKSLNLKDVAYVLELEITKEEGIRLGDKLSQVCA